MTVSSSSYTPSHFPGRHLNGEWRARVRARGFPFDLQCRDSSVEVDRIGHGDCVADGHQQARLAMHHDLRHASAVGRDNRLLFGHAFDNYLAERLTHCGRVDHDIQLSETTGNIVDESHELDGIA